jgi:hypothetical protein
MCALPGIPGERLVALESRNHAGARPRERGAPVPLLSVTGKPKRVAVLPVRDVTSRPNFTGVARALEDSLRRATAGAGYALASDAELVRLMAEGDMSAQRRVAEGMGIGAVIAGYLGVSNRELQAQLAVVDVWRNAPQSLRSGSELEDSTGTLSIVRDVMRALNRVSWRRRDDPRRLLLFDFDNQTGLDSLVGTTVAFADSLRAAVTRRGLQIIADSAARATRDANERRFVGLQLNAGVTVAGSVARRGSDSLRVRLTVRDMSEERTFETADFMAPLSNPLSVLPSVVERLWSELAKVNWGPKGLPQSSDGRGQPLPDPLAAAPGREQ